MTLSSYSLLDAAKLLQDTRALITGGDKGILLAKVTAADAKVAAGLTNDNILVITGSRGLQDYSFYNLRPLRPLPRMTEIDEMLTQDLPKKAYHRGFLLDLSRFDAAPLIAFTAPKETDYGTETDGRISR